jgi:hypothetical protein
MIGTAAALLAVSLSLLLSHFQVLAQPMAPATLEDVAQTEPVTHTSQTRSPEKWATITEKESLTIEGVAWDAGFPRPFPGDTTLSPISNYGGMGNYNIEWTEAVSATNYVVYEDDNPEFDSPTIWDVSGTIDPVFGRSVGTYYYRVRAYNAVMLPGRWSNTEAVTVTSAKASEASSKPEALSMPVTLTQVTASDQVTVQMRIDSGDWQVVPVTLNAGGWWDWTYEWTLAEEDRVQHTISTRAKGADGVFGPVDTITVTVDNDIYIMYFPYIPRRWPPIPYAPTLNNISNDDENGDYVVSWSYGYTDPPVTNYTLQEASDADFTDPTEYSTSSTSYTFSDKDSGTYYYRVRGNNSYGPGEWSNTRSVSVRSYSYYYDFNSSTKVMDPWPIARTSYWRGDLGSDRVTWTEEHDGTMYLVMDDKWDFAIASPKEEAPALPYTIRTRVRVHDPANLVAYGIVFGGNEGSPCPAYRDTGCFSHYYRLEVIWDGGGLKAGLKRIDYHEPESSEDRGKGRGKELIDYEYIPGGADAWNTWKFVVRSDGIDIYLNDEHWESTSDDKYVDDPYFGVYASANEYKPAIGRFDYFYVEPD